METNARYLYVGGFVLGSFILAIFFVLWIGKDTLSNSTKTYVVNFQESVVGLKEGSQVLYRGVPVGVVRSISLNSKNQSLVSVKVDIDAQVAINQGTEASLRSQGITGVTYIEITGNQNKKEPLILEKGDRYPVIPSVPSRIESIMQSAPDLVASLSELAENASRLVNKENRDHIANILESLDQVTTSVNEKSSLIPQMLIDIKRTFKTIEETAASYHSFIQDLDKDLLPLVHKVREIFDKNEDGINVLLSSGLYEFTKMLSEMRKTLSSVNRLATQIERDPQSFLFGETEEGYVLG